ncbi:hypothetical protein P171DRAFT_520005 [Karstenula rhodostoma CBS 690.94]|uniref:NadR/Ttd14 AAA domain-containing protein n=1 Tax=Karstenula rhodostoma CBS 690.94 TaxID=1392251 RepID=A0A9P4PNH8_9PLEO|nr:hypothetical protein P171DRAFT_520005 [Karstenula rhodostoma CBS 690.94]
MTTSPTRALQLQNHILDAQFAAENAASPATCYISDRSGLDPIVYAQLFASEQAARDMLALEEWTELERRMKAGIVVLSGTEEWMHIDSAFRELLAARDIHYTVVPKDVESLEARVKLVLEHLNWVGG